MKVGDGRRETKTGKLEVLGKWSGNGAAERSRVRHGGLSRLASVQSSVTKPCEFKRDTKFLSMKRVTSKAARDDSSVTWPHAPVLIGAELSVVLVLNPVPSPPAPSGLLCKDMTCCHSPSSTLLLVLLSIAPQLPAAAPLLTESPPTGTSNGTLWLVDPEPATAAGAVRTHRKVEGILQTPLGQERFADIDSARALVSVLLEALDHPSIDEKGNLVETEEYIKKNPWKELEMWRNKEDHRNPEEGMGVEENIEIPLLGVTEVMQVVEKGGEEKVGLKDTWVSDEENQNVNGKNKFEEKEGLLQSLLRQKAEVPSQIVTSLQRKTRGYFQNIDLGLQDNEILPPLKGYKAYNQQLALASKKLKWQEERERNPSQLDRNFMDDFDFIEEEEEVLPREEEEARARAEQEEVRKQEAEAQEAREEEQRLADIASDMLLEYMGRKQKTASYMKDRKNALLLNNVAEDKRSNEVEDSDDDEMDPETIDKLIEISSKLHLPADDVVEIITDVEEKKKRKDPPPNNAPRFRPLVPLKAKQRAPIYQYPKSPKKASYKINPYKKWYKEKSKPKFNKQDYWFKPEKQLLAYPSFPYYQKPYRAYYPVYFPSPKPRFYTKPALSFDYNFGDPLSYGFKPPKRRYKDKAKGRERNRVQGARRPQNVYPLADTVISNYILPHPRTYQMLPVPKARSPPSAVAPGYYYHPDYAYDEPEPVPESDDELENFIEKIYYNRRLF
ncbi:hypothetical protein C0J50_8146 [Silurus asotus]|uniref:Neurosecretory protein VGF n=1 Tax=Silurus asotus TaxID=30991 RepID=A0AAD5FVC5_SILAS|nr:hypothetical protein C0J50_8146 [Silurus asotus]